MARSEGSCSSRVTSARCETPGFISQRPANFSAKRNKTKVRRRRRRKVGILSRLVVKKGGLPQHRRICWVMFALSPSFVLIFRAYCGSALVGEIKTAISVSLRISITIKTQLRCRPHVQIMLFISLFFSVFFSSCRQTSFFSAFTRDIFCGIPIENKTRTIGPSSV